MGNVHLLADCIFRLYAVKLMEHTYMQVYKLEEGRLKVLKNKEDPKSQPHQIVLALDLTALKFHGILTVDFLEIQSNGE